MDRTGADFEHVITMMRERLGANAFAVQYPLGEADLFTGVIDIVAMRAFVWDDELGATIVEVGIPDSLREKAEALRHELQEMGGLAGTEVRGAQVAGFGVSIEPGSPTWNLWKLLARWVGADRSPLVILLDEMQTTAPEVARGFLDAVQEATTRELPLWLLAAGTPDAPRRIRQAGTFSERMFEQIPIGRLTREATLGALTEPAADSGLPLEGGAAARLACESQDYPYFVQLFGSAAWEAASAANEREITEETARRGIAAVRPRIERFYAQRFNEARGRRVERVLVPLAAALRDRNGRLEELETEPLLADLAERHSLPGDGSWLLDALADLGILWQSGAGGWEMGIPSFGEYVLALSAAETHAR